MLGRVGQVIGPRGPERLPQRPQPAGEPREARQVLVTRRCKDAVDADWQRAMQLGVTGVPTFVANQEEGNYLINYHAMSDTYDKVDMTQLKKHVAEMAELAFALADSPERVGPRLTRAQIEHTMHETHLDDQMKVFGIWQQWESGKRGRTQ